MTLIRTLSVHSEEKRSDTDIANTDVGGAIDLEVGIDDTILLARKHGSGSGRVYLAIKKVQLLAMSSGISQSKLTPSGREAINDPLADLLLCLDSGTREDLRLDHVLERALGNDTTDGHEVVHQELHV